MSWKLFSFLNPPSDTLRVLRAPIPDMAHASQVLDQLSGAADFQRAEGVIRTKFNLQRRYRSGSLTDGMLGQEHRALLDRPELANLYLFHGDGRLREAALNALSGPLRYPVVAYGVVCRMNDWSAEVRATALRTLDRCIASTPVDVLIPALWVLLLNGSTWMRWGDGFAVLMQTIARRADLMDSLAQRLVQSRDAGTSQVFRSLSRVLVFDAHLSAFATRAAQPHLRALAVRALSSGRLVWLTGARRKIWINKALGETKSEPVLDGRDVSVSVDLPELIKAALQDPSIRVRKAAVDAVIQNRHDPGFSPVVDVLLSESETGPNLALEDRLDFLRRHRAGTLGVAGKVDGN